jgi:hypothetical protein
MPCARVSHRYWPKEAGILNDDKGLWSVGARKVEVGELLQLHQVTSRTLNQNPGTADLEKKVSHPQNGPLSTKRERLELVSLAPSHLVDAKLVQEELHLRHWGREQLSFLVLRKLGCRTYGAVRVERKMARVELDAGIQECAVQSVKGRSVSWAKPEDRNSWKSTHGVKATGEWRLASRNGLYCPENVQRVLPLCDGSNTGRTRNGDFGR